MSQHRSLRAASTLGGKRNVLKRFERTALLEKRGQRKDRRQDHRPAQNETRSVIRLFVESIEPSNRSDAGRFTIRQFNGSIEMRVRLQKFLADAGVASRRAGEQFILEGRVAVNGQVVRLLGTEG